jgi:hypothetical protein
MLRVASSRFLGAGMVLALCAACGTGGGSKDASNDGGMSSPDSLAGDPSVVDRHPEAEDMVAPDAEDVSADRVAPDADAPADDAPCSFPIDVGCFTGEVCASPHVEATCIDGKWRCPAGSSGTESCPSPG